MARVGNSVFSGALIGVLWATTAVAQTAPPTSQVRPPEIPAMPSVSHIALPQVPAGARIPAQAERLRFILLGFEIQGEFPDLIHAREALAAGLVGRRITVAQLFQFANGLQQLYVKAGYPLVRAVIEPQKIGARAWIRMRVVDGHIERIDASAIPPQVRSRVKAVLAPLYDKPHLPQAFLERKLLIAGEAAGLDLNATFAAGSDIGGAVLVLTGRFRPISASLYADNSMPTVFGGAQIVTTGSLNSPLGLGDQLTVSVAGYPVDFFNQYPRRRFVSGSYIVPLGTDGLSLELYGTEGWTTPNVDPLLATAGMFQQANATLSYEAIVRRDYQLTLHERIDITDEQNYELVTNPAFPLSVDRLRVARTGLDGVYHWRETGTTLSGGGNYSHGFDLLGARSIADASPLIPLSRLGANDVFDKIDGHVQLDQALPRDFFTSFSASGQYSFGKPLLVSEQMDVSGSRELSGLAVGDLIGDSAYVVRGEIGRAFAAPFGRFGGVTLSPYLFTAFGDRVLYEPSVLEVGNVSAVNFGGGLRYNFTPARPDAPQSYGFIEFSRLDANYTPFDQYRLFVGTLIRY